MLSRKLQGIPGKFETSDFTATKWNTAEEKARMANKITKFILNGFQRSSFTKEMYKRMSCMFGHIAEYDIHGFHTTWFEDNTTCLKWAENVMHGGVLGFVVGDPAWTWSDVEKVIQKWISKNHIVEQIRNSMKEELLSPTIELDQETQLVLFQYNVNRCKHDKHTNKKLLDLDTRQISTSSRHSRW